MSNNSKEHLVVDKGLHKKLKLIALKKDITLSELTEDLILKGLNKED